MALIAPLVVRSADSGPPLTPDGDDARRWAEEELSRPSYDIAQPTPFDIAARAVRDFFVSLFSGDVPEGLGNTLVVVAAIVVAVLIVVAILIWGVPRRVVRSRAVVGELFGEAESRSAAQLRSDAEARAATQDWDAAIILRFRALARGLAERGLVDTPPGATVHTFARAAGRPFPASADELESAAAAFDDVRYLRRPGSSALYRRVAAVDDEVAGARPVRREEVPA